MRFNGGDSVRLTILFVLKGTALGVVGEGSSR